MSLTSQSKKAFLNGLKEPGAIALTSHGDPDLLTHYSGIPWHFREGMDVAYPGLVRTLRAAPSLLLHRIVHFRKRFFMWREKLFYNEQADPLFLFGWGKEIGRQFRAVGAARLLVHLGRPEWTAFLPDSVPFIFWHDTLFEGVRETYPFFQRFYSPRNAQAIRRMEALALQRCRAAVFSSEWAAAQARALEPSAISKIFVIPFGANFQPAPLSAAVETAILDRGTTECRLLFIGYEWERKGGDRAIETVRKLRELGVSATLDLLGPDTAPAEMNGLDYVKFHPRVDKSSLSQMEAFRELWFRSHFLLLPSRGDCSPLVLAEAAAFGVPSVVTDVGGIVSQVAPGNEAATFGEAAFADGAAALIRSVHADPIRYREWCRRSRADFDSRLNWRASIDSLLALCSEVLQSPVGVSPVLPKHP